MSENVHPGHLALAIVSEDAGTLALLSALLEKEFDRATTFPHATALLASADLSSFDLILSDLELSDLSGIELVREIRVRTARPRVIIMTRRASVPAAVEAMKAGANDFLEKPFRRQDLLRVARGSEARSGTANVPSRERTEPSSIAVGRTEIWRELLAQARRVAPLEMTVLLRGETGTGKEVLARYLASSGPRAAMPFVALNCAALPDELIESELFGHVRGAFSGATSARLGLLAEAHGGTLFLDEVGALGLPAQAKLLRFLEDRQVRRVGENRSRVVDVRIVAATNLDMESAIARREFREDLYFRLNVVSFTLPPLRDRRDDISPLAEHFLDLLRQRGGPIRSLSERAVAYLRAYDFPGNVRELRHAVDRAAALSTAEELEPSDFEFLASRTDHFPASHGGVPNAVAPPITLDEVREALSKSSNNRRQAARELGISRSTLYRLLRRMPAST